MKGARLWCVAGDAAAETAALLRDACGRRGVAYHQIDPAVETQSSTTPSPCAGDGLVVAGAGADCQALAERLWRPGMVSLQAIGEPPRSVGGAALAAAGVRTPLGIDPAPSSAASLAAAAARLGGFPVLLRLRGGEGGRGVMRVDGIESLVSVRDALPDDTSLVQYVPHVAAWRVIVVGTAVVATEAWRPAADDFRTNVGGSLDVGRRQPAELAGMALAAAQLLGLQFAGADVMEAGDGRCWLAEVNSPCWFVDTQRRSGVDIAGLIVERLLVLRAGR